MKRTTITAVVALSGALALAGCGSSGSTATTAVSTTAATTASSGPTTSGASASASGSSMDAAQLATAMGQAMVAAKSGKGTLSMSSSAMSMDGTTQFVYTTPTQADAVGTMSLSGLTMQVVTVGGVIYMKGLPTQMTGGKPWVKIDPNGSDAMSKALREGGGSSGDPQTMVNALKGGTATVVDTNGGNTHYRITGLSISGAPDTTMDLTVDSKNLPVTSVIEAAGTKVTTTYSDWGAPVTVSAPPADQVGTMALPTPGATG